MKRSLSLVLSLCLLFLLSGMAKAEEITNPILKKLVEKGILTSRKRFLSCTTWRGNTAENEKKVEQKIEQKVTEATSLTEKQGSRKD